MPEFILIPYDVDENNIGTFTDVKPAGTFCQLMAHDLYANSFLYLWLVEFGQNLKLMCDLHEVYISDRPQQYWQLTT